MSERPAGLVLRRLLVALDDSAPSRSALEAAAALAARFDAELVGLFVEDEMLLRLADIPLGRVVAAGSTRAHAPDRAEMERGLRLQSARARSAMEKTAGRERVRWSFRVVRGAVAGELLSATGETDLICLGRASFTRGARLGSTARRVALQAGRAVWLLPHGECVTRRVAVVYDGSGGARLALGAAVLLAVADGGEISVLLRPAEPGEGERLQAEAERFLGGRRVATRYRTLADGGPGAIADAMRAERGATLVVAAEGTVAGELERLLDVVGCPVLLVR